MVARNYRSGATTQPWCTPLSIAHHLASHLSVLTQLSMSTKGLKEICHLWEQVNTIRGCLYHRQSIANSSEELQRAMTWSVVNTVELSTGNALICRSRQDVMIKHITKDWWQSNTMVIVAVASATHSLVKLQDCALTPVIRLRGVVVCFKLMRNFSVLDC